MTEKSLAAKVRESLTANRLPREKPLKTWMGFGGGKPCDGCGDAILRAQVAYEIQLSDDDSTYRLHTGCHGLWLGELIRRRRWNPGPPSRPGMSPGN